ncbi:MAG: hypothetical protein KGO96_07485 [Elusimicrobia bacterium]|nr:hypothetical protein [Elusimicrobiota bacterium]
MHLTLESPTKLRLEIDCPIEEFKKLLSYESKQNKYTLERMLKNKHFYRDYSISTRQKMIESMKKKVQVSLVMEDEKGFYTYPGLLETIKNHFGIIELTNLVEYPEEGYIPISKKLEFPLYYYQEEMVNKLIESKHASIERSHIWRQKCHYL